MKLNWYLLSNQHGRGDIYIPIRKGQCFVLVWFSRLRKVSLQADWMFPSSHLLHNIECNHGSESRFTSLSLLSRSKTTFMGWTDRNTADTFLVRYIQMACVDANVPSPLTEWSCKKSSFKPSGEFLSLGTHGKHQTLQSGPKEKWGSHCTRGALLPAVLRSFPYQPSPDLP